MLNFWYSERCHRQIKLVLCVLTCVLIYMTSQIMALSPLFIGLSLALGAFIHVLKQWEFRRKAQQNHTLWLEVILFSLPLLVWLVMITYLPALHRWALMLQVLGFSAMGLFVVSIYSHRAKRHP